jgi:DNA-directed RNA polymerase specialized sigma24 family protein
MDSAAQAGQWFRSTHWSVMAQAAASDLPGSRGALESLCGTYWSPLYYYAVRLGYNREDARDLTQGFFQRLIEHSVLASADPERGKFRSFLLGAFKHFMAHEREKALTQKRGGGLQHMTLDDLQTPELSDPLDDRTPDRLFEQRWAIVLFEQVLGRLREEFRIAGQESLFDTFKSYLTGECSEPYAVVAARIGMTEGAAKMVVSRLRGRYRQLLRAEIARTVSNPSEVEEEIRYLRQVFVRDRISRLVQIATPKRLAFFSYLLLNFRKY